MKDVSVILPPGKFDCQSFLNILWYFSLSSSTGEFVSGNIKSDIKVISSRSLGIELSRNNSQKHVLLPSLQSQPLLNYQPLLSNSTSFTYRYHIGYNYKTRLTRYRKKQSQDYNTTWKQFQFHVFYLARNLFLRNQILKLIRNFYYYTSISQELLVLYLDFITLIWFYIYTHVDLLNHYI